MSCFASYCLCIVPCLIVVPLLVFLLWVEPGDEFMNEDPVEYVYEEQAFDNPENFAGKMIIHYCRMLLTRQYDQRPFDETMCDAIIANGGVKNHKKVQNICDGGYIKHGSDFSCVCDLGHIVQFN